MKAKHIVSGVLILCLALSLAACGQPAPAGTQAPVNPSQPVGEATPTPGPVNTRPPLASNSDLLESMDMDKELAVRIAVTADASAFSVAKMAHDAAAGDAALNYAVSVLDRPDAVAEALKNGAADLAVLSTGAAARLYHESKGAFQVAALSSQGMLYVVVNNSAETVETCDDLMDKTVSLPGGMVHLTFDYLMDRKGLTVARDTDYADAAALRDALVEGKTGIALLSEPYVSAALAANDALAAPISLAEEWDAIPTLTGSLAQSCLVVSRGFTEAHPAETYTTIKDFGASTAFLTVNGEAAAEMIVEAGLCDDAKVAETAIPRSNLCFLAGFQMWDKVSRYLEAVGAVYPEALGGEAPADDFYYFIG